MVRVDRDSSTLSLGSWHIGSWHIAAPYLPGEEWLEIRNPFMLEIGDDESSPSPAKFRRSTEYRLSSLIDNSR
jgi:hypothetical protein